MIEYGKLSPRTCLFIQIAWLNSVAIWRTRDTGVAFFKLKSRTGIDQTTKIRLHQAVIQPVLLREWPTWTIHVQDVTGLKVSNHSSHMIISKVRRTGRIANGAVPQLCRISQLNVRIQTRLPQPFEHILCKPVCELVNNVLDFTSSRSWYRVQDGQLGYGQWVANHMLNSLHSRPSINFTAARTFQLIIVCQRNCSNLHWNRFSLLRR